MSVGGAPPCSRSSKPVARRSRSYPASRGALASAGFGETSMHMCFSMRLLAVRLPSIPFRDGGFLGVPWLSGPGGASAGGFIRGLRSNVGIASSRPARCSSSPRSASHLRSCSSFARSRPCGVGSSPSSIVNWSRRVDVSRSGQCGGIGWTGATSKRSETRASYALLTIRYVPACAAGTTCITLNPYYSSVAYCFYDGVH